MTKLATRPSYSIPSRPRRLRMKPQLRDLVRETELNALDLVQPLFVRHGKDSRIPIASMPGQYQLSLQDLRSEIRQMAEMGMSSVMLFGLPEKKDAFGADSYCKHGIIQQAISVVKETAPEMLVMTDVCFCEYTHHGHCGIMENNELDNDATLELLCRQALSHVEAGADLLVPSGMIDGAVMGIRQALDSHGHTNIPIMHHTAKFASSFYAPFRDAAQCAPQFGDRRSYQLDPANGKAALREAKLDIAEGADILLVKPASIYLDVVHAIKQAHPEMPLAAYHVSGEYAMIKAAAQNGWIDEERLCLETLTGIKRAGADIIISYYAKEVTGWL